MDKSLIVVGGGMAGLSAAGVAARAGLRVTLLEQAGVFAEVGAGIQLGPNAVRVLHDWGLEGALRRVAAFPDDLWVRDAASGLQLGHLRLGATMRNRYGQPYATIHRADLHALLLEQVRSVVDCHLNQRLELLHPQTDHVQLTTHGGRPWQAGAVLGCDGLWSQVRAHLLRDGSPQFSGHLAYRGLVPMADLPPALRRNAVTAWLAPGLHAVYYPVRAGEYMNVVVVVEGPIPPDPATWDHAAHATDLQRALGHVHADLSGVLQVVPEWRLWPLNARIPMRGAHEQAQGRIALLGDAAHPMRPYLAQGAAMALEDAWSLGRCLTSRGTDWPTVLADWSSQRWQRNAWVQERSRRNGIIFHASGPLRWGRNLALALGGEHLLDVPRLYGGPPVPQ